MHLKIINVRLQVYRPGANELISIIHTAPGDWFCHEPEWALLGMGNIVIIQGPRMRFLSVVWSNMRIVSANEKIHYNNVIYHWLRPLSHDLRL